MNFITTTTEKGEKRKATAPSSHARNMKPIQMINVLIRELQIH